MVVVVVMFMMLVALVAPALTFPVVLECCMHDGKRVDLSPRAGVGVLVQPRWLAVPLFLLAKPTFLNRSVGVLRPLCRAGCILDSQFWCRWCRPISPPPPVSIVPLVKHWFVTLRRIYSP